MKNKFNFKNFLQIKNNQTSSFYKNLFYNIAIFGLINFFLAIGFIIMFIANSAEEKLVFQIIGGIFVCFYLINLLFIIFCNACIFANKKIVEYIGWKKIVYCNCFFWKGFSIANIFALKEIDYDYNYEKIWNNLDYYSTSLIKKNHKTNNLLSTPIKENNQNLVEKALNSKLLRKDSYEKVNQNIKDLDALSEVGKLIQMRNEKLKQYEILKNSKKDNQNNVKLELLKTEIVSNTMKIDEIIHTQKLVLTDNLQSNNKLLSQHEELLHLQQLLLEKKKKLSRKDKLK